MFFKDTPQFFKDWLIESKLYKKLCKKLNIDDKYIISDDSVNSIESFDNIRNLCHYWMRPYTDSLIEFSYNNRNKVKELYNKNRYRTDALYYLNKDLKFKQRYSLGLTEVLTWLKNNLNVNYYYLDNVKCCVHENGQEKMLIKKEIDIFELQNREINNTDFNDLSNLNKIIEIVNRQIIINNTLNYVDNELLGIEY
jgi:hypothetical protein